MDGMIIYKYGKFYIMFKVFYYSRLNLEFFFMIQILFLNYLEKFLGIYLYFYYLILYLYWLNFFLYMKIYDFIIIKNYSFKNVGQINFKKDNLILFVWFIKNLSCLFILN